ncbi:MAG: hypothetical protein ABIR51_05160 [Sphingomicrobium sp.]
MRCLIALLLLPGAAPAVAQPVAPFDPAAEYIAFGQDEAGYRSWAQAVPGRPQQVGDYYRYLASRGVAGIVPTWQLLRTATAWRSCAAEPFEVPPASEWPNIVETLEYVRAHVIPVVGPVEPVSVYRNEALNVCAKGAPDSAHRHLYAVDLVPLRPTSREALMRGLCAIHEWQGGGFAVGLGFYKGLRFHVDSKKFRKWGAALGDETTIGCPQVMAAIAAEAAASRAAIAARQAQALPPAEATPPSPADPLAPQK